MGETHSIRKVVAKQYEFILKIRRVRVRSVVGFGFDTVLIDVFGSMMFKFRADLGRIIVCRADLGRIIV